MGVLTSTFTRLLEGRKMWYESVCLNTEGIPPDDLDDMIMGKMIQEAGVFYKMEFDRVKINEENRFSE